MRSLPPVTAAAPCVGNDRLQYFNKFGFGSVTVLLQVTNFGYGSVSVYIV